MRKLVHEEIDREISDKAVHLAYRFAGKPTAKAFFKALSVFPGMPVKAAGRKVIHDIGQKIHPTEGKQSVKTLIRQGQVKKPSVEKTSVLEKLKKFKEIVAAIPKKVAEKKKERSR